MALRVFLSNASRYDHPLKQTGLPGLTVVLQILWTVFFSDDSAMFLAAGFGNTSVPLGLV